MKKIITLIATVLFFVSIQAQMAPAIQWQKSLGGSYEDEAFSVKATKNGGCVVVGMSNSIDGDVSGNHGDGDVWVVNLDSSGALLWQKALGGSYLDGCYGQLGVGARSLIQQTTDDGFILVSISSSNNGDVTGHHGIAGTSFNYATTDIWVVKLNSSGVLQWQKSLGGASSEVAYSVAETNDGGYVVAGSAASNDGDVSGNHGYSDYWVVKLNSTGVLQWQKTLGGIYTDEAFSIKQTPDSGYIVAGYSGSADGNVTGHHGSAGNDGRSADYWIVKLTAAGSLQWQKSYGGAGADFATDIQPTTDGGYLVAGITGSGMSGTPDGDVTFNHFDGSYGANGGEYWIVKLNSIGTIEWQKSLGGTREDGDYIYAKVSAQQTKDGNYIIAGSTTSEDGDVTGFHRLYNVNNPWPPDYWVVKLDNSGSLLWQKVLGGYRTDYGASVQQTTDGGYVVAGFSQSDDGDITGHHGSTGASDGSFGTNASDYWVVKLAPEKSTVGITEIDNGIRQVQIYPNPSNDIVYLKTNAAYIGSSYTVTDLTGKKLMEETIASELTQVDINKLSKGLYFIQIAGSTCQKIAKQ